MSDTARHGQMPRKVRPQADFAALLSPDRGGASLASREDAYALYQAVHTMIWRYLRYDFPLPSSLYNRDSWVDNTSSEDEWCDDELVSEFIDHLLPIQNAAAENWNSYVKRCFHNFMLEKLRKKQQQFRTPGNGEDGTVDERERYGHNRYAEYGNVQKRVKAALRTLAERNIIRPGKGCVHVPEAILGTSQGRGGGTGKFIWVASRQDYLDLAPRLPAWKRYPARMDMKNASRIISEPDLLRMVEFLVTSVGGTVKWQPLFSAICAILDLLPFSQRADIHIRAEEDGDTKGLEDLLPDSAATDEGLVFVQVQEIRSLVESFSPIEREIFHSIAEDLAPDAAAVELNLSPALYERIRRSLCERLAEYL